MDTVFFMRDFPEAKPPYVKSIVAGGQVSCQEMLVLLMMSTEKSGDRSRWSSSFEEQFADLTILWLERAKEADAKKHSLLIIENWTLYRLHSCVRPDIRRFRWRAQNASSAAHATNTTKS